LPLTNLSRAAGRERFPANGFFFFGSSRVGGRERASKEIPASTGCEKKAFCWWSFGIRYSSGRQGDSQVDILQRATALPVSDLRKMDSALMKPFGPFMRPHRGRSPLGSFRDRRFPGFNGCFKKLFFFGTFPLLLL